MTQVIIPELGEGIKKAVISCWYFKEGERLNEGDDLLEISTDKATFNISSPASGTLIEIFQSEGSDVEVGEAVARIENAG